MSGIVGVVNLDGTPVDKALLRRMTRSLAYRGPDKQNIWVDGQVGFGHALLSTTVGSADHQPATLDGSVWITADARLDGRADLVRQLESRGRENLRAASDAQLILHAYHAWGDDCVDHLLGDFAFAIWDGAKRRLLCARDHFGLKPFFYAPIRGGFIFSNTLDCLRLHPAVSDTLNELAIGDFLLFGSNQDPATTSFVDILRLAPAHCLAVGEGQFGPRRFWTLPADGRIRHRRSREYIDHFLDVLRRAVSDRLPAGDVEVCMSGGIDSTSIAAIARQVLSEGGAPFELHAQTIVYDSLIPDEEGAFARIAADAIGVEVDFFRADGHGPLEGWDRADFRAPEPVDDPFFRMRLQHLQQAASRSRVLLCGEGGDEVLWNSQVVNLLGTMRPLELAGDIARSLVLHRRRPAGGMRGKLKQRLGYGAELPPYPAWMRDDFTERLDLRRRWEQVNALELMGDHPLRPEAHARLSTPLWSWYFESSDPGVTRVPIEARYPFLDLRLVSYLLAIPPLPWCINKHLLRVAMHGSLPDSIRHRPKMPLGGDPLRAQLREAGAEWVDRFEPTTELARFVDRKAIPPLAGDCGSSKPWLHVRPLCLDYWLGRVHSARYFGEDLCDDKQVDELEWSWPGEETVRAPAARGVRRHS